MQEYVIARKYAKALADLCDTDEIVQTYTLYATMAHAFSIDKFCAIIASHVVTREQKLNFLENLTDLPMGVQSRKLLSILVKNDRVFLLPFVAQELKKIVDKSRNVYQATLHVKQTLDESLLVNIQNQLGKKLGVTLNIVQHVDVGIDGIRLEVVDLGIEVAFLRRKFTQELQDFILKAI